MSSTHPTKRLANRIRRHVNHHSDAPDKLALSDIFQALARAAGYANDARWVDDDRTMPDEWNDTVFAEYLTLCGYLPRTVDAALETLNSTPENRA